MNIRITQATLLDESNDHHGSVVDIRIKDGIITDIAPKLNATKGEQHVDFENLIVLQRL